MTNSNFVLATDSQAKENVDTVKSSTRLSLAMLSVARDSLRILSAFGWGKESRLSKNKSAQLCDLMNACN